MAIRHLACALLAVAALPSLPALALGPFEAVRPVDARARAILEEVFAASDTVRRLAADLGRTDVIAYVQITLDPQIPKAVTQLAASTREGRYVRVSLNAMLGPIERTAMLAHELWHVLEIAHAPEVRTQNTLRAFYQRSGWAEIPDKFETDGARDAERRARKEMFVTSARPQPEETRPDNFPVTNGVTNGTRAQHLRGGGAALR